LRVTNDLAVINNQRKDITPVADLKQVEVSLNTLESRLSSNQQLLPRPDRRRGILNLGGTVLKALFQTVSMADVHELHSTLGELKSEEADIVNSLGNQVTCVKGVSWNTRMNTDAITNLSSIVKKELVQSHDRCAQMTGHILCRNMTFFNYSSLFS